MNVGVGIPLALRRSGQVDFQCRLKTLQDAPPYAFVLGAAAMALVEKDRIEEIRRIIAVIWCRRAATDES